MVLAIFDAGRRRRRHAVEALYGATMAHARDPGFFRDLAVPDTLDGRFDVLTLHMVLLLRRLKAEGESSRALAQELIELMFADMDRSLREMGVGDYSIGRRVKQMISAFHGRARAYGEGLDGSAGALEAALGRNIYRGAEVEGAQIDAFAAYVRESAVVLDAVASEALERGEARFATPAFSALPSPRDTSPLGR